MFYVAKFIQAVGFAEVGYGLLAGMTQENGLRLELRYMLIGVVIFYVGRLLEHRMSA